MFNHDLKVVLNVPRDIFQLFDELSDAIHEWEIDENEMDIATVKYFIKTRKMMKRY
jgi:hypothetical protein